MFLPEFKSRKAQPSQLPVSQQLNTLIDLGFWLDHRFRLPFTRIGVGWDPLIGGIPIVGDLVTLLLAARIIVAGYRLNIGNRLLAKMVLNSGFDFLIGMIPFVGFVADIFFRSNLLNLTILLDHVAGIAAERKLVA